MVQITVYISRVLLYNINIHKGRNKDIMKLKIVGNQVEKLKSLEELEVEDELNESSRIYKCKGCGKVIHSFMRKMSDYAYKLYNYRRQSYDYYCCYKCYREAQKKKELRHNKEYTTSLLNKYNGVLTLKECEFMEDCKLELENNNTPDRRRIRTRIDFERFIEEHYDVAKEIVR